MRLQNEINKDISRYIIRENYKKIEVYVHIAGNETNSTIYEHNGSHTFTSDYDREKIITNMINTMSKEGTNFHKVTNDIINKTLILYIGL